VLDDLGLEWIEEPLPYDHFDGDAILADALHTLLQLGENFYGPLDLHLALEYKACDSVMPDFMRIAEWPDGYLRPPSPARPTCP
jgi:mandelate racemase